MKLKAFKEKIENATKFDEEVARLIGIELYNFIQSEDTLKTAFEERLNYLKNLARDKDFVLLQGQLFDSIQSILKLTSLHEVQRAGRVEKLISK